jgi:hypothetical protein
VPKDIDRLEKGSEWSGPHFRQNPEAKGVALRAGVRSLAVFRRAPVPGARRVGGAEHALLRHRQCDSLCSPSTALQIGTLQYILDSPP